MNPSQVCFHSLIRIKIHYLTSVRLSLSFAFFCCLHVYISSCLPCGMVDKYWKCGQIWDFSLFLSFSYCVILANNGAALSPLSLYVIRRGMEMQLSWWKFGKKALCSANVLFVGVIVFVDLGFRDSQCFFIVIHMRIIVTWLTQTWWLLSVWHY